MILFRACLILFRAILLLVAIVFKSVFLYISGDDNILINFCLSYLLNLTANNKQKEIINQPNRTNNPMILLMRINNEDIHKLYVPASLEAFRESPYPTKAILHIEELQPWPIPQREQ